MIVENVISRPDIDRALEVLSTCTWQAGVSHHEDYAREVKRNEELRAKDDIRLRIILNGFEKAILNNRAFSQFVYPKRWGTLRFNRCKDGGFYGAHADSSLMKTAKGEALRSDLSMTLWLTDDYEGGELKIEGMGSFKGKPGDIMVYPSYYVHEVTPVTQGERICAVMWFQSLVRDESKRALLKRFYDFGVRMKEKEHLSPDYIEVTSLYNNLLRQWTEL